MNPLIMKPYSRSLIHELPGRDSPEINIQAFARVMCQMHTLRGHSGRRRKNTHSQTYADKIALLDFSTAAMSTITIEHNVTPAKLDVLYVDDWPVWSKGVSEFDWEYDQQETCYIIDGSAIITPENGEPVTVQSGDLVVFPKGMKCVWKITEPIEKHYKLD